MKMKEGELDKNEITEYNAPPMIRKAKICDADAIARCHHDAVLSIDTKFYSKEQINAWCGGTEATKYLEPISKGEIFVIEITGQLCAFGWMKVSPPEIRALYVSPAHQGEGFASQLLELLEQKLLESGATEIMIGASLNAKTFYEKHHYLPGAQETLELNGVSAPYISMRKRFV